MREPRVNLLGGLHIDLGAYGGARTISGPHAVRAFAYLVLHRERAVSRSALRDAVWIDELPGDPNGALRALLKRMRRALGGDILIGDDALSLRLPSGTRVDVEELRKLVERAEEANAREDWSAAYAAAIRAVELARSSVLPDVCAGWLEDCRAECDERRLRAHACIAGAALHWSGADLAQAERSARALVASDPYRENAHALLIELLERRGEATQALRAYEHVRGMLREIGVVPGPRLRGLHARMINAQPLAPARATAGRQIALPRLDLDVDLVGRTSELAWLEQRFERAQPGRVAVAFVEGDAGIGKTRLLAELARVLHGRGVSALWGACHVEQLVPYEPFVSAVRQCVDAYSRPDLQRLVHETGDQVLTLAPELERLRSGSAPPPRDERAELFRLLDSICALLCHAAHGERLLLVLDDLHWADAASLLLLRHMSRFDAAGRVLVVCTYRDAELALADRPREALGELRRAEHDEPLRLSGLGPEALGALVGRLTGAPVSAGVADALHRSTHGNPLFVNEIVRSLPDGADLAASRPPPRGVKDVIAARVNALGSEISAALIAASVIGPQFELGVLERVVQLSSAALVDALDRATRTHLIVECDDDAQRFRFAHGLVREALYSDLTAVRRLHLHGLVAEALEQLHADDAEEHLSALAMHFSAAATDPGGARRAIDYCARAARRATLQHAHADAVAHWQRSLKLITLAAGDRAERCDALIALGESHTKAGDLAAGRDAFAAAIAILSEGIDGAPADAERLARAALGYAGRWPSWNEPDERLAAWLEQAAAGLAEHEADIHVRTLARLALERWNAPEGGPLADRAVALARRVGAPHALGYALSSRQYARWSDLEPRTRLRDGSEMLRLGTETPDDELALEGQHLIVIATLELAVGDGRAQIARYGELAARTREPRRHWQFERFGILRAMLDGDFEQAERASHGLCRETDGQEPNARQNLMVQISHLRWHQGRLDELLAGLATVLESAPRTGSAWRAGQVHLLAQIDRRDEARAAFEVLAADGFESLPRDLTRPFSLSVLSEACAYLGDRARASQLYRLLAPMAGRFVITGFDGVASAGPVDRYLGLLASVLDRFEQATRHFDAALAQCAAIGTAPWQAETEHDLARMLARLVPERRDDARALATSSARTARRLGMRALVRRAQRTLEELA